MSASSTLFSMLEGVNQPLLEAPESVESVAKSEDGALFVSLMKQYQPEAGENSESAEHSELLPLPNSVPLSVPVVRSADDVHIVPSLPLEVLVAGNALPLVAESTRAVPAPWLPDQRLEDFAVGMGIDRELARLLLTETAANDRARFETPSPSAQTMTDRMSLPATPVPQPQLPSFDAQQPAAVVPSVVRIPELTQREAAPALPAAIAAAAAVLSDEDVLRWRAVAARQMPSSGFGPKPSIDVEPMRAEDAMLRSLELGDPLRDEPDHFAAASAVLRGLTLERAERRAAVEPAGTPSPAAAAASSTPTLATVPLASGLGGVPGLQPTTDAPALGQPATSESAISQPLRLPDAALAHEQRVDQFSNQVAQRLLQQIRQDRWTVSLQLDPQNLGPMDIELQLEGTKVSASVGVANAEVRNLLEAALPKLRESLDAAGLNLASWSFAHSGFHEQRERAETLAALTRAARSAGAEAELDAPSVNPGRPVTTDRAVDLYV